MRRVVSVWLPTFSTDLVRRRLRAESADGKDVAILLTRAVALRELVARCCARSAAAGITEGMDLAHARSLVPAHLVLHHEHHRPDRDAAALHALACRALRFSPLVAPDSPDGLLIDSTGTERLHRGEPRLIRSLARGLHRLGFSVRIAAASTFGCAWGVARYGEHELATVAPGMVREAIEVLPAAALRVPEETIRGLADIAITTVGDVLRLPRASVASRFDPILLLRVRQALGEAPESIEPVRPAPPPQAALIFDGPTNQWESVEAAARQVLEELAAELARCERGIRRLDVELLRPHADPVRFQIILSRASRAVKHLWSLLHSRLEKVDLGDGIEGVMLTATRTGRLRHEQVSSDRLGAPDERASDAAWSELVDTLVGRLNPDRVVQYEAVESHLPEQTFRERSVLEAPPTGSGVAVTTADRPTILFRRPEPAEAIALTPDGPVYSLGWRGWRWSVHSCTRPERIAAEWWRWGTTNSPPPDRDYFSVHLEGGRRLWVCRHVGTNRWFVHGEWA